MRAAWFRSWSSIAFFRSCSAIASDADKLFGNTWKVVSAVVEDVQTKETNALMANTRKNYLSSSPSGRMMALLISEEAFAAPNRRGEKRGLSFHGGLYGEVYIEGNKWTTKPDVAWNESYMMDQVRNFRLDGDRLIVETLPAISPDFGKVVRFTVVWQKDE